MSPDRLDRLVAYLLAHREELTALRYGRLEVVFNGPAPDRCTLSRVEQLTTADVDGAVLTR